MRLLRSGSSAGRNFDNLASFDTLCADIFLAFFSGQYNVYFLQVWHEQSFGVAIRVRDPHPHDRFFSADNALFTHD